MAAGVDRAGIGYLRRENCLIDVADVAHAQGLLDMQSRTNWTTQLDEFAALVHPLRANLPAWPRGRLLLVAGAERVGQRRDVPFAASVGRTVSAAGAARIGGSAAAT